jgi:hypothetical protein
MPNHFQSAADTRSGNTAGEGTPVHQGRFLFSRKTGKFLSLRNMAAKFLESPHSRRRGLQTPPHLHFGKPGQGRPVRETGAVCLVIGDSEDGVGRPATRAKALNL